MQEDSKNYINQYKFLFYSSWVILYFIFPVWHLPQVYISFTNKLIQIPYWRHIFGFFTYFLIAAFFLNHSFKTLFVDRPFIVFSHDWPKLIRNNLWLVIACCIAVVLHIFNHSLHVAAAAYSLWIYNFINSHWHRFFDSPVQYTVWIFIFLLTLTLSNKKLTTALSGYINKGYSACRASYLIRFFSIVCLLGLFILYTRLMPSFNWVDHIFITGYPPLGTLLYLMVYALFGTGNVFLGPIVVQSTFYVLGGVFLYKTINIFYEKEVALLGASIYLFSPLIFSYATVGHLGCGTVFFIISVSYFFLKYVRDGEDYDLVLTALFISTGCLYKRIIILMFFICCAYLIVRRIRQKDLRLLRSLKVLLLAPISFLPWYFLGTRGADSTGLSNLASPDSLFSALLMVLSQLSWPVFLLFMLAIILALYKRDHLSVFFGIVFIVYYILFTSVKQQTVHRYSMSFYPTISVFLSLFIYNITKMIRWKHAFKTASMILIIYLAVLCMVPRSSTNLITFKYTDFENQRFPIDESLNWILNETGSDEKVLWLHFADYKFYALQHSIDPEKIYTFPLGHLTTMSTSDDFKAFRQNLKEACKKLNISYIVFKAYDERIYQPFYNYMFSDTSAIKRIINDTKIKESAIKTFLKESEYDYFMRFHMDGNYIYIFRLKEDVMKKHND